MFKNAGEKIQELAKLSCAIIWIGAFIWAIICIIQENNLMGTLILIIGGLVGSVSTLCMYGFGELIEDTRAIRHALEKANEQNKTTPEQPSAKKAADEPIGTVSLFPLKPIIVDDEYIQCPICNRKQIKDRNNCQYCGQKFKK